MNEVIAESILQKITDKKTSVFTIFFVERNWHIYSLNVMLWRKRLIKLFR